MSHKYRPPDSDLRPDPAPYSSDRHHTSLDREYYRPPQASFSPSYPSSSSSRGSAQWSQEGALSILSSCGLEPSDLSLLAELPEDVLTVESLPHVLNQLKGKRGTVKPFSTNAPSFSSSSSHPPSSIQRSAISSSSRDWDQLCSQPVQYPLGQVTSCPLPSEKVQDHWGNPTTSSSVRADPPSFSSSSSTYMVDFHHRPSDYGKTGRAARSVSSRDPPSVRSAARDDRTCPSRLSESGSAGYRSAPPPEEHQPKAQGRRPGPETSSIRSSQVAGATSMPTKKEALDFHGTLPEVFPYSCSLCDITVLSERVWTKHINGTYHADGQLSLLQQFPKWDCRMETVSRADNQSEKSKNEERPTRLPPSANESQKSQSNKQLRKKTSDKSQVVCVKFPAQSVNETYLRKLTEPFGKILKILMFPSLAFVELGSVDQAKDLVKFHNNCPPTVNGEQMEFSISNTFSFLQSSRVVSFTPAPTGEDGRSDLISIIKRFGQPLYTLFLPSMVFVEMKNVPDAQKLVDYYSAKTLRINSDLIKVSLSGEYRSLMRVASATRYEEETPSNKTATSRSREQEDKMESKRKRPRSRERTRDKSRAKRSRSSDESNGEKKSRSRDRSRSRDKSTEKTSRDESRSRSRSRGTPRGKKSRSREKSCSRSSEENGSREKTMEPEQNSDSKPEPAENRQSEEEESSAEDSDIEGMEVIGEDGENVDDEEEEEEEDDSPAERKKENVLEEEEEVTVEEEEVKKVTMEEEASTREREESAKAKLDDEEGPDFPVDLENCITLDELEEEQFDDSETAAELKSPTTRVIFFKKLPLRFYTDAAFVQLVKGVGTAVRYFLIRRQQQGFIEMSTSAEALKAAQVLNHKTFHGSRLFVNISHKYTRLVNGYDVQSDSDMEKSESRSSRRRDRISKSRTSDSDEACRKSESRRESGPSNTPKRQSGPRKTPERESGPRKTPVRESGPRKTPERESGPNKTAERDSGPRKTPERESGPNKTPERESGPRKSPERESERRKTPERESGPNKTPERESGPRKTPERELVPKMGLEDKMLKGKVRCENESFPEKKQKSQNEKVVTEKDAPEKEPAMIPEDTSETSPDQPQTEQKSPDSSDAVKLEQQPVGGIAEPEKPTKPVGTKFVRPVVGYFCHLCQVIYADEDEAKLQHCSSLTHYRKYQEKTGIDPWTS